MRSKADLGRLWFVAIQTSVSTDGFVRQSPQRQVVHDALKRDMQRIFCEVTQIDQERCIRWVQALEKELKEAGDRWVPIVCWAAVAAWDELKVAPWSRFARATERLAKKEERPEWDILVAREADELKQRMEVLADDLWKPYWL